MNHPNLNKLMTRLQQSDLHGSAQREIFPCKKIAANKVLRAGKQLLSFADSDQFNLAENPALAKALIQGMQQHGFGNSSSRLAIGSDELQLQVEKRLASFLGTEAALLVASRSQACITLLSAITNESDLLIFNEETHSPLTDLAYLLGCQTSAFQAENFSQILTTDYNCAGLKILVLESNNFTTENLELVRAHGTVLLAAKFDLILIDETFALGTVGLKGAGLRESLKIFGNNFFIYGDLGAKLPIAAGYLAASNQVIKQIQSRSRVLNFERPQTPPNLNLALTGLDLLEALPNQRLLLQERCASLKEQILAVCNFAKVERLHIPCLKLNVENSQDARHYFQALIDQGILLDFISYSGLNRRHQQMRIFINSAHSENDFAMLLEAMHQIKIRK